MRSTAGILCIGIAFALAAARDNSALEEGVAKFQRGDYAGAAQALGRAARERPSDARIQTYLGMAYAVQEDYKSAENPLRRACALNPAQDNACYFLGRTLYNLSRFEDALDAFETALRHAGRPGRTLNGMALAWEALGRVREAERCYREAIRQGETRAQVDYGMFLYKTGRTAESVAVLRKAHAEPELARVMEAMTHQPALHAGASQPSPVNFQASTLPMVLKNDATGSKYLPETMTGGVAIFDYNNDGWPDIYVVNGATLPSGKKTDPSFWNRLFRNNGDGTFTDVTEAAGVAGHGYSMGVAAGDFDNDGFVDLLVTGVGSNTLFRNKGDGTFEDVTDRAGLGGNHGWSVSAGWFDYDRDGRLDLFVVRYVIWDPATEIYCGERQPGHRSYCHPKYYQPLPNLLYHNQGDGTFRDVSRESGIAAHAGKGLGLAFGDYDGDGFLDVFVSNDSVPNFLFHNNGNGTFDERGLQAGVAYNDDGKAVSSMGVDFRDYDNDGREDIFVTALSNESYALYRNLDLLHFTDVTYSSRIGAQSLPWAGWGAGMFDFNNDGFKDIFTANSHVMDNIELTTSRHSRQPNSIFLNKGDGTFDQAVLGGEALHRGAAFGDLDRDGRLDVVVTRLNESPLVLRNVSAATGHWIAIDLKGTRSNRDAIGARVHIVTSEGAQWNRVTTAVGYASSSERTVHFGLGAAQRIDRLEVDWPSGTKQVLEDLPVDRYLPIVEPPIVAPIPVPHTTGVGAVYSDGVPIRE
ncbi:MAG TPA: FG-GAP-like repeat-containing protein [Bryobacteraceae bacterium]|nr:FG-GAP-like repeat-containing protein [Bryobacteraceae bacterium]